MQANHSAPSTIFLIHEDITDYVFLTLLFHFPMPFFNILMLFSIHIHPVHSYQTFPLLVPDQHLSASALVGAFLPAALQELVLSVAVNGAEKIITSKIMLFCKTFNDGF